MSQQNLSRALFEVRCRKMVEHAQYLLGMPGLPEEVLRHEIARLEWFLREGARLEMWEVES